MALEDIIAQRISAAAQARARLDASNYSLEPIRAGLATATSNDQNASALALRRDTLGLQQQEFDASQQGVPAGLASVIAPTLAPPGTPTSGLDGIVAALGARGGANLLAKLSAYTAIAKRDQETAAANLKAAAGASAYARILKEGPNAIQPSDPLDAVSKAVDDWRAGQNAGKVSAATKDRETKDAAKSAWIGKYGSIMMTDPSKLPPEALTSVPPDLADNIMSAIGAGSRFNIRMAFNKAKWDATLKDMQTRSARADAMEKAGDATHALAERKAAFSAATTALTAFENEHGMRKKLVTPSGDGFVESYLVDPSGLPEEARTAYTTLVQNRDDLARKLGGMPASPAAPAVQPPPAEVPTGNRSFIGPNGDNVIIGPKDTPPAGYRPYGTPPAVPFTNPPAPAPPKTPAKTSGTATPADFESLDKLIADGRAAKENGDEKTWAALKSQFGAKYDAMSDDDKAKWNARHGR